MRIVNGLVFCEDGAFHPLEVETQGDRIAALEPSTAGEGETLDAHGGYVVPGFVDIHIHGAMGADFSDGDPAGFATMGEFLLRQGVTSFLGTSMALPEERLSGVFSAARAYMEQPGQGGAAMRGIYMEGPFFSPEKRGAQNPEYVIPPDLAMFERLLAASGEGIRVVAVAPELPGSLAFIQKLKEEFRISLGHSNATYEQAMAAFAAGASQVTHLYNAMSPMTHRAPGLVGAALDREDGWVELIGDGIHVAAPMIRNTFKMFGKDRILLISDSLRAAGMPDGAYELGGQTIRKRGSRAVLAGSDTLAGSVSTLLDCLRFVVREAGVPLEAAVQCAAVNPVRSLGLEAELGSLMPGKRARLVCLDEQLNLRAVWLEDGWVPLEITEFG